jgi:hypothetical protein
MAYDDNQSKTIGVAAMEGAIGDWAMYIAHTESEALRNGIKLSEEMALQLANILGWYKWRDLTYRD